MNQKNNKWSSGGHALIGYSTIFVLLGGVGAWAALTQVNGAVVASGVIEVASNRQVVQHLTGGVIGEILVKEGSTVQAGDVLMRLDDTFDRSELAVIEGQLLQLAWHRSAPEGRTGRKHHDRFRPRVSGDGEDTGRSGGNQGRTNPIAAGESGNP